MEFSGGRVRAGLLRLGSVANRDGVDIVIGDLVVVDIVVVVDVVVFVVAIVVVAIVVVVVVTLLGILKLEVCGSGEVVANTKVVVVGNGVVSLVDVISSVCTLLVAFTAGSCVVVVVVVSFIAIP